MSLRSNSKQVIVLQSLRSLCCNPHGGPARLVCGLVLSALAATAAQEWPFYGGDQAGTKYSPLEAINRGNGRRLGIPWTWKTAEGPREEVKTLPGMFEATRMTMGGVLDLSTA